MDFRGVNGVEGGGGERYRGKSASAETSEVTGMPCIFGNFSQPHVALCYDPVLRPMCRFVRLTKEHVS